MQLGGRCAPPQPPAYRLQQLEIGFRATADARIVSPRCAGDLFSNGFSANDLAAANAPKWANVELNDKIR
jgi:hypothetical protein